MGQDSGVDDIDDHAMTMTLSYLTKHSLNDRTAERACVDHLARLKAVKQTRNSLAEESRSKKRRG